MKRNFTKILAAFALLVFTMPSLVAWGQTYSRTTTISVGDVVVLVCESKTAEMGAVASYGASVAYTTNPVGVNPLTVEAGYSEGTYSFKTSENKYLSWTSSNSLNLSDTKNANSSWSVSFSGNNVLINNAFDATRKLRYNASSPRFACYTSDQTAIQLYKAIAAAVTAPTVTPNSQSFVNELEVTITPAEGTTAYYTTNGTDPDNSGTGYTTAHSFTINQTTEVRAIAYNGTESSSIVTKEYTKVTPLANIAALTANTSADTYYVTMDNAVVTYVNGNYAYIQDASGAVVFYKNGHGLTAGDALNGTATVVYQVRNGNPQITDLSGINPTSGTAPEPTEVTAIDWSYTFTDVLSQFFKVTGATITQDNNKYYISLGGESIQLYKIGQAPTISDFNATYTVVGFPTLYVNNNGTTKELQIFVDPEMEVGIDPVLSVNPTSLSFTYTQGATEVPTESFSIIGSNLTDDVTVTLPSNYAMYDAETGDPISSPYTLTPEDGVINTTLVVELNSGLQQGSYNGSITIAWEGEEDLTVALTGTVTEPEPENVTWDLTTATYNSASAEQVQWTSNYATMTVDKNGASSNANAYLNSGNPVTTRFYNGQKLTFAAEEGYEIDHVVITGQSGYVAGLNIENWTNASAMADGNVVTVTPTNGNNPFFVIINATIRLTSVTVYYAESTATFYDINIDDTMENGTVVANPIEATEGTMVTLTIFPAAGYYLEENNIMVDVTGVEVTKVNAATYTFTMPANDVTVSAVFSEYTGTYYTLVTSADQLVAGRHYIIASSKTGGAAYAMGAQTNSTYRDQVEAVVVGTMIYETEGVSEIVLNQAASNLWVLYDEEKPGYLYASSVSNNNLGTRAFNNANNPERGQWAISFSDGVANIVSQIEGENAPNTIRYNAGSSRFSCYPGTQAPVYLYLKANETNYSYVKDINAYEGEGGYVLVASPVSTTPVAAGMITDEATDPEEFTFDLYKFDQNANDGLEWRNYRATSFDLVPGEGYLYANKNNVTISFAGTAYNGDGQVPVVAGYNLVGNPYAVAANLSVPYYRLNASGSEVSASTESSAVNAMEGVFVQATEAGSVTFTTSNSGNGKSNAVVMNLTRNRGTVIDNAIVRFDNGRQLPKFQLFENSTKLYIPQGNKDFAIVRSAAQGEMPVSFRASENGTYTIAVEAENVDMNYLHLIDNMTGADVDLLATPNYTFEARTNDYTSRFRLVFSANGIDEQTAETFAFFNGTSWTVSNTGDATLQVVDITGRIVSSETINGNATVSLNQPAGIYMLRLVNGNDVKVQKVVVR